MFKRWVALTAAAVAILSLGGCAKLIPSSTDEFSAAKTMVVTFRDGETLTGRFAEGEDVTFVTFGRVYRAQIEDIGPPDIVLIDAYVQEEYDRFNLQRSRMENSILRKEDGTSRIVIPRYKIVDVEEKTFDRAKTARNSLFWAFSVFVLSRILSARL